MIETQVMEKPADRRALALGLFHTLSDELICCVLELLAAKDLAILSCVSSVFYIFCNEDPLWMKLCLQSHEGLLRYAGSWKHTAVEKLNNVQRSSHASSNTKLHFDGFSSLFLYRQWYRCNVNLSYFGTDCGMIDRRHGLSLEEFVSDYDGKKPLLLDGLADRWPAMQRWSIDNLAKNYGKCVFKVAQNDEKKVLMRFEDYASYMSQQHDEDPLYIFDPKFGEVAPDLIQDYEVPNFFKEDLFSLMDDQERPPFRWLVIGPARSGASWHVDPALTSAWNTLLRGWKRWALYPPGRVPPSVIVHADEEDGDVDVDSPSSLQWWLDVYPALKDEDKPLECIQLPGETIFVPSGWWHCVLNLDTSVAVTQNFVNSTNLELVCLDLTPGYRHRGVARAGRLALQERASAVIDSISKGSIKESDKPIVMGAYQRDWNFTVDFLASFVDQDSNLFLHNPMKSDFLRSQSVRKWLQRLWFTRPDLRHKVWKGACILLDAKSWLERVVSICDAHDLPHPTEAEQLPVGNGSNPVFLVGRYVVKLCLDEASEDKAIDGLSSELHFYSELKECGSPLKHAVPDLVASGVVYFEDGTYTAVAWDGKNEPQDKYHKRQTASLRLGEFRRARWNQAVLNPLYLEPCEDDSLEARNTASLSYPYIITDRCEGEDFAHMRARMGKGHILALASFLGEHIHNLHCLPLPPVSPFANSADKPGEVQKILETNGMIGNVDDNQQKAWICKVPGEWNLFINMMRRQREHAITRLQAWGCVPAHLITQVEDYLPSDPVLLAGVHKVIQGIAQMGQPVWLHMDVTDENIQVVPGTLTENKQHTEHTDADRAMVESIDKIRACYILDFGDVCLGDPLYELVSIYLDVFQGNSKFVECFLASYRLSLSPKSGRLWTLGKGWNKIECVHQLPYRAMCYTILHEENALGAVFSIWKELKLASTWKEVEQKVWGFLTEYDNEDLHLLHDQM